MVCAYSISYTSMPFMDILPIPSHCKLCTASRQFKWLNCMGKAAGGFMQYPYKTIHPIKFRFITFSFSYRRITLITGLVRSRSSCRWERLQRYMTRSGIIIKQKFKWRLILWKEIFVLFLSIKPRWVVYICIYIASDFWSKRLTVRKTRTAIKSQASQIWNSKKNGTVE